MKTTIRLRLKCLRTRASRDQDWTLNASKNAEVRTKYNDCMRKKSIKRRMEISRKFGNYKISLCKLSGGNPKLQKRKRALDQRRHVKANRWKKGNWSKTDGTGSYRVETRLMEEYNEKDNAVRINVRERMMMWITEPKDHRKQLKTGGKKNFTTL